MATLAEYFDSESRTYLERLQELAGATRPDPAVLHRTARALRGTAQMAREERVYRGALALETAARGVVEGRLEWTDELHAATRAAVMDLAAMVERSATESALDARLAGSLERWQGVGVSLPPAALGEATPAPAGTAGSATAELRAWAAREVDSIARALEQGITELGADPMNRQALKAILRRQRALLGAARLDEIPVVAEILRAIEDMTRVIAKLDVGVKQEWLDVFRVARDGLASAVEPLRADADPASSHSLARLRHLRAELLERYGAGEAVSAAGENHELVQAQPARSPVPPAAPTPEPAREASPAEPAPELTPEPAQEPAPPQPPAQPQPQPARAPAAPAAPPAHRPAGAQAEPVPIEELQYRGEAAVRRALELRPSLETALRGRTAHLETLDELYDLLRLARD